MSPRRESFTGTARVSEISLCSRSSLQSGSALVWGGPPLRMSSRASPALDTQLSVSSFRPHWVLWAYLSQDEVWQNAQASKGSFTRHVCARESLDRFLGAIFASAPYNGHLDIGIFDPAGR